MRNSGLKTEKHVYVDKAVETAWEEPEGLSFERDSNFIYYLEIGPEQNENTYEQPFGEDLPVPNYIFDDPRFAE